MQKQPALFAILSHIVASAICLVVLSATPIVMYGVMAITGLMIDGDMGGPLNILIVPIFSILLALFTTLVILLPITAGLQWLSARFRFSRWIPLLAIFPTTFAGSALIAFAAFKLGNASETLRIMLFWSLIGSGCFALYWITLNLIEMVLNWLSRSFRSNFAKTCWVRSFFDRTIPR
jgi:hypothetical protein